MGLKHRDRRKELKLLEKKLRNSGFRENELGELVQRVSKADARRKFVRKALRILAFRRVEREVVDLMIAKAVGDIQSIEDERIFLEAGGV